MGAYLHVEVDRVDVYEGLPRREARGASWVLDEAQEHHLTVDVCEQIFTPTNAPPMATHGQYERQVARPRLSNILRV